LLEDQRKKSHLPYFDLIIETKNIYMWLVQKMTQF